MRKGSDPRWFVVISLLGLLWMYLLLTGPSSFDLLFNPDMGSQLTKGMEILHGRHPFLEVDSGVYGPAIFYLSALGQSLDEQRLLPEIVLIFAGHVLAYAALFSAFKVRSHGALLLGTFGILAILSLARFHKYHILIGPAVFLLCLHFANDEARPWRTAAVLALGTAIAGLFRLDFGAYCALASIVLLLLKYSSDGTRQTSVSLLVFVGTGFILTSPWLALLVLSGDPVEIIERVFQITWGAYTGLSLPLPPYDFSRSPLAPGNGHFLLFWTFRLVPIIVAAILVLGYLGRRVRVRRDNADIKTAALCTDERFLLVASLVAALFYLQASHRIDPSHTKQVIPPALFVLFLAINRLAQRMSGSPLWLRGAGALVAVGLFASVAYAVMTAKLRKPGTYSFSRAAETVSS